MKICLLSYRGNPFCGGQGVYVTELGRELARQGHAVHLISGPPYPRETEGIVLHRLPSASPFLRNGRRDGLPPPGLRERLTPLALYERAAFYTGRFPEMTAFSCRAWRLLRALPHEAAFDVVHDNQGLGWGMLPMRAWGVPLIATIHHPLSIDRQRAFEPPTSFGQQWSRMRFYPIAMQGFVARRMDRIVTVSQASAEAIAGHFRVPRERIRVIPNGLDGALFRPPDRPGKAPGRVIYVGNLNDRNKGVSYLLRAMARVVRPWHLAVVGAGAEVPPWVRALAAELGIGHRISFEAQLTPQELVSRYGAAEVAACPSLFEGFGFPAAEAMACGLPVVAARGGALPEVVGDAGLLVPTRDPEALARAIDTLLGDPALRERLGRAARARVLERFRWSRAASALVEVYQEVIDAHDRL
jgi:glycosyltransferase involved in cell wall biosynthesis